MSKAEQKDLQGELAMLRSMLEMQWNRCSNNTALLLASGPISEMISKIKGLVETIQKIDLQSGVMLDKNQIIQLGQEIVAIIMIHITDTAVIEEIANGIATIIERTCAPDQTG